MEGEIGNAFFGMGVGLWIGLGLIAVLCIVVGSAAILIEFVVSLVRCIFRGGRP